MKPGLPGPRPGSRTIRPSPWVLWLLLGAAILMLPSPPPAGASEFRDSLTHCIEHLSRTGKARPGTRAITLSKTCPRLSTALGRFPARSLLATKLGETSSFIQLRDLQTLLASYEQTLPKRGRLDFQGLPALLDDTLIEAPPRKPSLLELFSQWLWSLLDEHRKSDNPWFLDLLEWLIPPPWVMAWIGRLVMGALLIGALFVIVNELHQSGLARRLGGRSVSRVITGPAASSSEQPVLSWHNILRLPVRRRPGALLRFVVALLADQGLVPDNRSLTNRELLARLEASDQARARQFKVVVTGAESELYGNQPLDQTQLLALMQAANHLRTWNAGDEGERAVA